jgi:hypothetical protein
MKVTGKNEVHDEMKGLFSTKLQLKVLQLKFLIAALYVC